MSFQVNGAESNTLSGNLTSHAKNKVDTKCSNIKVGVHIVKPESDVRHVETTWCHFHRNEAWSEIPACWMERYALKLNNNKACLYRYNYASNAFIELYKKKKALENCND